LDALDWTGLLALAFAAGAAGGLVGVGGGVLFVPALVLFADQSQLGAQATSLVGIVLVALVGTWRQHEYGNLRLKGGAPGGCALAARRAGGRGARQRGVGARTRAVFAGVQLFFAWRLAKKAVLR
jgi:uncharacterized membrane protein YfcA